MPRPSRAVGYAAVLRHHGAPRVFAAATLARLSYGMVSLTLLLAVSEVTDSYAVAGTCVGAYAFAGLLMPLKSRLVDRHGQRAVLLPLLSATFAVSLLAVAVVAGAGVRAGTPYLLLCATAGFGAPPLGPAMRALWAVLAPEPAARQRAYSLDAVVEDLVFTVGPLAVAVLALAASAPVATAVTGALNLGGTLAMVGSPAARRHGVPADSASGRRRRGPLRHRGVAPLVALMTVAGLGGGPLELALVARTQDIGRPASAGALIAALSAGGALGGLAWGRFGSSRRVRAALAATLLACTATTAATAPVESVVALGCLTFLAGAAAAPLLITAYLAVDNLVPPDQRREASTWVGTASNLGVALDD